VSLDAWWLEASRSQDREQSHSPSGVSFLDLVVILVNLSVPCINQLALHSPFFILKRQLEQAQPSTAKRLKQAQPSTAKRLKIGASSKAPGMWLASLLRFCVGFA